MTVSNIEDMVPYYLIYEVFLEQILSAGKYHSI